MRTLRRIPLSDYVPRLLDEAVPRVRTVFRRLSVGGWNHCPGCNQSCTGSYLGYQACTRCQLVVL